MPDHIKETIEQKVILERLNNLINTNKTEHAAILAQTTKTNGNVADIQKWRSTITGGLIVSNAVIVPVLLFLLYERLKVGP